VLHGDERALAERLPVWHRRATTGVDSPRERERARRRGRPEESDETLRVRADLLGGERGVAALPRHVRVGDQPAQVRVPGRVSREEQNARVHGLSPGPWQRQGPGLPNRERRAEDRTDAFALAGVDEPGGAVEPVSVGERDRRHPQLGGPARERLG
jgi:hypothetical protein